MISNHLNASNRVEFFPPIRDKEHITQGEAEALSSFHYPDEIEGFISATFLSHLFGDTFINHCYELQGWSFIEAISHMLILLKENTSRFPLKNIINELEEALQFSGKLFQISITKTPNTISEEDIKGWTEEITDKIHSLNINEKIVLPMGCPTHAVLYEVKRSNDQLYEFSVYNTGLGSDKHWFTPHKETFIKIHGIYKLTDITYDKLCCSQFFEKLIHIAIQENSETFAQALYDQTLPLLGGKRDPFPLNQNLFMSHQHSGTCAWKVFIAYLRYNLDFTDYKRFMTLSKMQVLEKLKELNGTYNFSPMDKKIRKMFLHPSHKRTFSKNELIMLAVMIMESSIEKKQARFSEEEKAHFQEILNYFRNKSSDRKEDNSETKITPLNPNLIRA